MLGVSLVNQPTMGPDDLAQRCDDAGLELVRTPTRTEHDNVRRYLSNWERIAEAATSTHRAVALNALLAEYSGAPRLTDHQGTGWHLHFRPEDSSPDRQLAALISVGTALHLTQRGMDRFGRCDAYNCNRLYADTSRNGRQRFCSARCGNRAAVRRHRANHTP